VHRFIDPASDLIVGATLYNNPTVQDPRNGAPAWGFNTEAYIEAAAAYLQPMPAR
jgi:hypothetical protein